MIRRIALFGLTAGLALAAPQAESARTSVARDFPVYDNGGRPDLTLDPQRFVAQMEIIDRDFIPVADRCVFEAFAVGSTGWRRSSGSTPSF